MPYISDIKMRTGMLFNQAVLSAKQKNPNIPFKELAPNEIDSIQVTQKGYSFCGGIGLNKYKRKYKRCFLTVVFDLVSLCLFLTQFRSSPLIFFVRVL